MAGPEPAKNRLPDLTPWIGSRTWCRTRMSRRGTCSHGTSSMGRGDDNSSTSSIWVPERSTEANGAATPTPRFSPDGLKVVIDSPHGGDGRQSYLIDISGIVK